MKLHHEAVRTVDKIIRRIRDGIKERAIQRAIEREAIVEDGSTEATVDDVTVNDPTIALDVMLDHIERTQPEAYVNDGDIRNARKIAGR